MNISFKVIPHSRQRYETVGDYWESAAGTVQLRVSEMKDWRYEMLVAFHEICELTICKHRDISNESIDAFDMEYENARKNVFWTGDRGEDVINDDATAACGCKITADSEPGDDAHAPYYWAHQTATIAERLLAVALGVKWDDYADEVDSL